MELALHLVAPNPQDVIIAGSSAGGFGAGLLADDVMQFLPSSARTTVCIDCSVLEYHGWSQVLQTRWAAPDAVGASAAGKNLIVDALLSVRARHGDRVNILFECSVRDTDLSKVQAYLDTGVMPAAASREDADRFQSLLRETVDLLRDHDDLIGIYVWDDMVSRRAHLTRHTILTSKRVFHSFAHGPSIADWVHNAVKGNVQTYGLELLKREF
jgi:hypothetical protein